MASIWHSLIWKEWHEHKWRFAALVAIALGMVWIAVDRNRTVDAPGVFTALLLPYCVVASVFVGMNLGAGERSRGTMSFARALPQHGSRLAIAKLVVGWLVVVIPVLLAISLLYAGATLSLGATMGFPDWSVYDLVTSRSGYQILPFIGNWHGSMAILAVLLTASITLYTAAAGTNHASEVRAAALGLLVLLGFWFFAVSLMATVHDTFLFRPPLKDFCVRLAFIVAGAGPGGLAFFVPAILPESPGDVGFGLFGAALSHIPLAWWYITRLGRVDTLGLGSLRPAAEVAGNASLPAPHRSRLHALAWKQLRESGSLALTALGGIVGIALVISVWMFLVDDGPMRANTSWIEMFTEMLGGLGMTVGTITAIVIGVGAFSPDLEAKLFTFWHSRPIGLHAMFWTKFLAGLACVTLVLGASVVGAVALNALFVDNDEFAEIPRWVALGIAGAELVIYTLAVALVCLLRNAVFACLATLFLAGAPLAWSEEMARWSDSSQALMAPTLLAAATLTTLFAWLVFARNWGWKR